MQAGYHWRVGNASAVDAAGAVEPAARAVTSAIAAPSELSDLVNFGGYGVNEFAQITPERDYFVRIGTAAYHITTTRELFLRGSQPLWKACIERVSDATDSATPLADWRGLRTLAGRPQGGDLIAVTEEAVRFAAQDAATAVEL